MKLRHIGHAAWAGAASVGLILGVAACGQDNTIDYLFVANAKNNPGQINVYLVDSESGILRQIPDSPYPSGASNGGRNPVSLVTSPNQKFLYALNHDDDTIVKFGIGTDAKLYPQNTYNTPGLNPTSMKMNAAGTFLYVTDAFQPQYSATNPGPGALIVYPICTGSGAVAGCSSSQGEGELGTPVTDAATATPYFPVCNNPVDLAVTADGSAVYVVNDPAGQPPKLADTAASSNVGANGTSTIQYTASGSCTADSGQINAFTVGSSGGLSVVAGSPFAAGSQPTAIVSNTGSGVLYIVDLTNNAVLTYQADSTKALTQINTVETGASPDAITIDAKGLYAYVANYSGSISTYTIASGTGALTGTGTTGANSGPTYAFIEPSAGKFLYVSGYVDNTVYGTELNAQTGALTAVENDPFPAAGQPTAIAAITHGKAVGN